MMKITKQKDYADDDSTVTVKTILGVTSEGCGVIEREFEYEDEDENSKTFGETLTGIETILEMVDLDAAVLRTLEELAEEVDGDELTLVED